MTQNALDNNREIFLDLGESPERAEMILSFYNKDCKPLEERPKKQSS
jgi:hypothetical protein